MSEEARMMRLAVKRGAWRRAFESFDPEKVAAKAFAARAGCDGGGCRRCC